MRVFQDPKLKKTKKHSFALEACQLTVSHETSLENIVIFPNSKKCPSTSFLLLLVTNFPDYLSHFSKPKNAISGISFDALV